MKSIVFRPVDREEAHPHACTEGVVYLTYTAYDEEVGDEVERIEVVPCRRCSEAPAVLGTPRGVTQEEVLLSEHRISPAGDPFTAAEQDRPCCCNDGWVAIGQEVVDPETGEETIEYALYLCRRCSEVEGAGGYLL